MKKETVITENELLAAFRSLGNNKADPGFTADELAKMVGHNVRWVRDRLKELSVQNRLVLGSKPSVRIDGKPTTVPCYRLLKHS